MSKKQQPQRVLMTTRHRSIQFNGEDLDLLEKVADAKDLTVSQIVRMLVRQYLDTPMSGGK